MPLASQQTKHSTRKKAGLFQSLPVPGRNWEQLGIDLIIQLPETGWGNDAIIVCVDRMSKMTRIAATQTKVTAPGCANLLASNVVKHHGVPEAIVLGCKMYESILASLDEIYGAKVAGF